MKSIAKLATVAICSAIATVMLAAYFKHVRQELRTQLIRTIMLDICEISICKFNRTYRLANSRSVSMMKSYDELRHLDGTVEQEDELIELALINTKFRPQVFFQMFRPWAEYYDRAQIEYFEDEIQALGLSKNDVDEFIVQADQSTREYFQLERRGVIDLLRLGKDRHIMPNYANIAHDSTILSLYLIALFFLTTSLRDARRFWRSRDGSTCISCGYALQGLASPIDKCPECGKHLAPNSPGITT